MKKAARKTTSIRKKRTTSRLLFFVFSFFLFLAAGFLLTHSVVNSQQQVLGVASPDEIIVRYKDTTPEIEKEKVRKTHKAILHQKINKINAEVVKIQEGTVEEQVRQLKKQPHVAYAEPNFKAEAFGITNDSSLTQQWGLFKINAANQTAQSAWDITPGSSLVKVAILDTGIEESHPDLSGKVIANSNFTDSATVYDQDGHGTHVAGITAAATNNASGVAGAGYNTALLNGKVLGDDGSGYYSWITNGIIWAADNGAQVINLSLGGTSSSLALQDAINYAWSKGAVVVAAAGNSNTTTPHYPAYYTSVIAVAATDTNDNRASFSNYGSWVDVAAPGTSIYSTYKGSTYATMSGTSMATPLTAGTVALIWANGSCATNSCVREQLEKTADKIAGTGSNWAWGRINAYSAVSGIPTPTAIPTPTNTPIPTPAKTMTVSDISMSFSGLSRKKISSIITVINKTSVAPLSYATVKATLKSPSGVITNFSGSTNSQGKVTFNTYSKEKGTFTITITNVTKSTFSYSPTFTTKTLLVQ